MTAVQSAYPLSSDRRFGAWLHARSFEIDLEGETIPCNGLDSAAHSRFFQVFSSLSSDAFERKIETCPYVIKFNIVQDTSWEDHNVRSSKREIVKGMIERLSGPSKADSTFGPELTEHAKKYGAAMDLADAVALDRRVDAKYAAREKARKSKNPGNRRA